MLTGKDQAPQECKNVDPSQSPKLYEIRVCFAFYGGRYLGTLCFDGPRSESLSPPCAPARHSKFKNSLSPITPLPPCLNLDHLCSSPGNLIPPFTVSVSPWPTLPPSPPQNFRKIFLIFPEAEVSFLPKVSFSQVTLWKEESILVHSVIYSILAHSS